MKNNTILCHLHNGTITANHVAEFLEELYYEVVENKDYFVQQGTSGYGVEFVKQALCSPYKDNKEQYVSDIYFDSLKNIKTEDKTMWMLNALQAEPVFVLSYKNTVEESRGIVKSFVESATEKELYAMRVAFENTQEEIYPFADEIKQD